MIRSKALLAAMLLATAIGCTDKLVRGASYRLVRASNNPLPILLKVEPGCRHMLYGGEVRFDGKRGFRSTFDIRKVCGDSTSPVPSPGTSGTFRIRNDTAFFTSGNRSAGVGLVTADSLVVTGLIHRLVYERTD